MIIPLDTSSSDLHTLIGVILCLRSLIPNLNSGNKDKQGLKGSFGVMVKDREDSVSREQLCKVSSVSVTQWWGEGEGG